MKLFFEILISLVLHPVAIILAWINLIGRSDLDTLKKILGAPHPGGVGPRPNSHILLTDGALW